LIKGIRTALDITKDYRVGAAFLVTQTAHTRVDIPSLIYIEMMAKAVTGRADVAATNVPVLVKFLSVYSLQLIKGCFGLFIRQDFCAPCTPSSLENRVTIKDDVVAARISEEIR